jgi:hypothetical protein
MSGDMWDEQPVKKIKPINVSVENCGNDTYKVVRIRREDDKTFYLTNRGWVQKKPMEDVKYDETMIWTQAELDMLYTNLMGLGE